MSLASIPAPAADEYAPYYTDYIASVSGTDLSARLEQQVQEARAACAALSEEDALFRYAPGKWSVKEVIGHLIDSERIFAYRILRLSRGDSTPLSGYDENAYVAAAGFDARSLQDLLEEFSLVRAGTLALLRSLPPETWELRGDANGFPVSVRAMIYIVAGHAQHHLRLLRERYGLRVPG